MNTNMVNLILRSFILTVDRIITGMPSEQKLEGKSERIAFYCLHISETTHPDPRITR